MDWLCTVSADQLQSHFAWHLKQSRATYVPHKHKAADDCTTPTVAGYDTLTSYPVSGLRSCRLYLQIRARTFAAQVFKQGCSRSEYLMDSEPKRNVSLLHECPGVRIRSRPDTYLACSVISRSNTHEAVARSRHMCWRTTINGRDCVLSLIESSTPSRSCRSLPCGSLHRADCRIAVNGRNCQLRLVMVRIHLDRYIDR